MSKAKHTPGPWKAFVSGKVIEVQAKEGKPIVGWTGFDESDVPLVTHRANARLIAAAPDLLAVAEKLIQFQRDFDTKSMGNKMPGNDLYSGLLMDIVNEAETAIAAAKGESS